MTRQFLDEMKALLISRYVMFKGAFLDVFKWLPFAWAAVYCLWFAIWLRSVLPGGDGILFGQEIKAPWAVMWQYHPSVILLMISTALSIVMIVYLWRTILEDIKSSSRGKRDDRT